MKTAKTMCVGIAAFFVLAFVAVVPAGALDADPASVKLRNVTVTAQSENPLGVDVAGIVEVGLDEYDCLGSPYTVAGQGCRFGTSRIELVIGQQCTQYSDGSGAEITRMVTLAGAPANLVIQPREEWVPRSNKLKPLPYQPTFTAHREFGQLGGDSLPTCPTGRPYAKGDPYVHSVNIFYTFEQAGTGWATRVDKNNIDDLAP